MTNGVGECVGMRDGDSVELGECVGMRDGDEWFGPGVGVGLGMLAWFAEQLTRIRTRAKSNTMSGIFQFLIAITSLVRR